MNGRFMGIKKSIILHVTALIMFFSFIAFLFLSIFIFKKSELWFFFFCIFTGIFELVRGFLFRIDNSTYLGLTLSSIGAVGLVAFLTNSVEYLSLLIPSCFCFSSVSTYIIYKQKFHLILAFSICFVTIYGFLLLKKLITFNIFIAFTVTFLILLVIAVLSSIKWR